MSNYTSVETYLDRVRLELQNLHDREEIIQELSNHIWDLANNISVSTNKNISESFLTALEQMEEPEILAKRFHEEEQTSIPGIPSEIIRQNPNVPTGRMSDNQIFAIAMSGLLIFVIFFIIIREIFIVNQTAFSIFGGLIQGIIFIAIITSFLYYRDNKDFKAQFDELKKKFEKVIEDNKEKDRLKKLRKTEKAKNPSLGSIVGVHISGLVETIFLIIWIAAILWASYTNIYGIFNDNWYYTGMIIMLTASMVQLPATVIKLFLGRIRVSWLIEAAVKFVEATSSFLLILFFPFNMTIIISYLPFDVTSVTGSFENDFMILLGLIGIIQFMTGIYNIIKYGIWQPTDRRSLITPLEDSST